MMYKTIITRSFENDLASIVDYLSCTLKSPHATQRFMDSIDASIPLLTEMPEIHAPSPLISSREVQARRHIVGSYLIIYSVQNNCVVFHRIMHQSQNYSNESISME